MKETQIIFMRNKIIKVTLERHAQNDNTIKSFHSEGVWLQVVDGGSRHSEADLSISGEEFVLPPLANFQSTKPTPATTYWTWSSEILPHYALA